MILQVVYITGRIFEYEIDSYYIDNNYIILVDGSYKFKINLKNVKTFKKIIKE